MKTLIRRAVLALMLTLLCAVGISALSTPQEFYAELYENLKAQKPLFSIEYDNDPATIGIDPSTSYRINNSVSNTLNQMAISCGTAEGEADCIKMNLRELDCTYVGHTFTFAAQYLLTQDQLTWVDTELDGIAKELFRENADDYEKVKAAYQYIATNFTYDDTLTKFTDYDGLTTGSMVCQGYALMMTKLLYRGGVPCRLITGWSHGVRHGWNLVCIDGLWYNVDVTWDAQETFAKWNHFLMNREDFTDHEADDAYLSANFLEGHPPATKTYETPEIDILIDGVRYSGLTIRKGKQLTFTADCTPATDLPVVWKSTNPEAVTVAEDGTITSVSPGFSYITAEVADDSYIMGVFPVTAVDLTSCSPWAEENLNALYLRQLYPAAICEKFQTGITREEFADLAYLWMHEHSPLPDPVTKPQFDDVADSEYWFSIYFTACRGVFDGTSDYTFTPKGTVTREQAAKIFSTLLDVMDYNLTLGDFTPPTDGDTVAEWAREDVDTVLALGLMQGRADGTFDPKGILTREEAAIIFERLCQMTIDQAEKAA